MTTKTAEAPATPGKELIDVREVAALLGCSARHVTRLHDDGKMPPAIKLGRLCRWNRQAIRHWIDTGCPPAKAN